MKGGFDHFMAKEIHEQPDSILQTMRGRVAFRAAGEGGGKFIFCLYIKKLHSFPSIRMHYNQKNLLGD